jgi:hypothetical protein
LVHFAFSVPYASPPVSLLHFLSFLRPVPVRPASSLFLSTLPPASCSLGAPLPGPASVDCLRMRVPFFFFLVFCPFWPSPF